MIANLLERGWVMIDRLAYLYKDFDCPEEGEAEVTKARIESVRP